MSQQFISYQGLNGLVAKVNAVIEPRTMYALAVNPPSPMWTEHLEKLLHNHNIIIIINPTYSENVARLETL